MHNNNLDLGELWIIANQWGTNHRIEQSNYALKENNRLLEQIRRQLLTPVARAAEDAHRKAVQLRRRAIVLIILTLVAIGVATSRRTPPQSETFTPQAQSISSSTDSPIR
jgi:hypothetical protein